jgi:hypothetical protein
MSTEPEEAQVPRQTLAILTRKDMTADDPMIVEAKAMLEALGHTVVFQDEEEYFAQGRVPDCDCMLLQCVCTEVRPHQKTCRYRVALSCAIPIECEEHGFDVCPVCDVCTCKEMPCPPNP